MRSLRKYAKYLKKKLAYESILKDLQEPALRELRKQENGQAIVDEVEFHVTKKVTKEFSTRTEELLAEMREKTKQLKEMDERDGLVVIKEKETFDAYIPKSTKEDVLAEVNDYKKHFAL